MQLTASSHFATWFCSPEESEPRCDPRVNLFFFPCAGAGPSSYFSLCRAFPRWVMPYVLRLSGRESTRHKPALTDIESMAGEAARAIRLKLGERPSVFWGHSMGTLVAFELARLLRGESAPALLVVSGHAAPQLPCRREPVPIPQLSDDAFVDLVKRYNGMPRAVLEDRDLLRLFLPQLRADFTALNAYAYAERGRLDCDVLCLNGQNDNLLSKAGAQAWREQTVGEFRCDWLPGGHFFLNEDRAAAARLIGDAMLASLGIAA